MDETEQFNEYTIVVVKTNNNCLFSQLQNPLSTLHNSWNHKREIMVSGARRNWNQIQCNVKLGYPSEII